MKSYKTIKIGKDKKLMQKAARWFHQKWGVPEEAYLESMQLSAAHDGDGLCGNKISWKMPQSNLVNVPRWYVVLDGQDIIAGAGVIENDFHERKDLTPNVCALYVEEEYRKQGIAGRMLKTICDDFYEAGIKTLYLVTEHTDFYERYGWEFLCMVREEAGGENSSDKAGSDSEAAMMRLYVYCGDKR